MANLTLRQFIKQLLVHLSDAQIPMPLRNQDAWHRVFYKLKKLPNEPGKPAFLNDLWFDWDGPQPESPDLAELLATLHWNASISAANPQYDTLSVPDPVATLWKSQEPALEDGDKQFIQKAVNCARDEFRKAIEAVA
jgi:hypothetical protein